MSYKIRPLLTMLAVTGALAGGGAAIASAATSGSSTTPSTTTTTTSPGSPATGAGHATAPRPGTAPGGTAGSGGHNCPNM